MPIDVHKIVDELDAEIERLKNIRAALNGEATSALKRRGRPPGAKAAPSGSTPATKRTMSEEGKKRIAEAQRRRWAAKTKNA